MWWLLVYDWEKVVSVCCLLESVEISWALTPEHTGLSVRLQKLADQLCVGLGLRQCVWIGIIVVYGMGSLVVVVVAGNTRHNNELQECGRRCRTMLVHTAVAVTAIALAAAANQFWFHARSSRGRPRVVGIIPARYNSSRFEGKPLVHIMGKPMIQVRINSCLLK